MPSVDFCAEKIVFARIGAPPAVAETFSALGAQVWSIIWCT